MNVVKEWSLGFLALACENLFQAPALLPDRGKARAEKLDRKLQLYPTVPKKARICCLEVSRGYSLRAYFFFSPAILTGPGQRGSPRYCASLTPRSHFWGFSVRVFLRLPEDGMSGQTLCVSGVLLVAAGDVECM